MTRPSILLALVAALVLVTEFAAATPVELHKRRFGQENPTVLNDIRALSRLPGVPADGRFDQIAGAAISQLLAATDPCGRYALADEIITRCKQFGCEKQGFEAARKFVAAEKNFNPFLANAAPNFCNDASLPKSAELRCIVPIIDPAAGGKGGISSAEFNQKANARLQDALAGRVNAASCAGKSVRQQAVDFGLKDCVGCADLTSGGGNNGGNAGGNAPAPPAPTTPPTPAPVQPPAKDNCPPEATVTVTVTVTKDAAAPTQAPGNGSGNNNGGNAGKAGNNIQTFTGKLFGQGAPEVNFVGGDRPFQVIVDGKLNGDFLQAAAALGRSCDVQKNKCANEVNGQRAGAGASVGQCDQQGNECRAAIPAGQALAAQLVSADGAKKQADVGALKAVAMARTAGDMQTFTGALLNVPAPEVKNVGGGRPFQVIVDGQLNGDFVGKNAALGRSCDVQHNKCANKVNSGEGRALGISVGDCDQQKNACHAAI
ncbi:hypothetical protein H9P43_005040 [Blastocladiella emersonii ATCC 22665]|nr:hypothetical protein H9P43_005040 [Blastocladiella emersonii ATCC 22665]